MSGITTHVLDTSRGARRWACRWCSSVRWIRAGSRSVAARPTPTGARATCSHRAPEAGRYRLTFDTGAYFRAVGEAGFYPEVVGDLRRRAGEEHYHVPLLLSPFGYSTYRGS